MTQRGILTALMALCLGALTACSNAETAGSATEEAEAPTVLIFSHSTGWRHKSIETGVEKLTELGESKGYTMIASEDPDIFSAEGLADVDAIILLNSTTGGDGDQWFMGPRGEAFQEFVHNGGGVVGIHGASDSHYDWPWYGEMMGGYFERHPQGTPTGKLHVVDSNHPSTHDLATEFSRTDEWYWIKDYNPEVSLLVTLDPASIGEEENGPKPISWYHEFEGGRVFYTSMGHTEETYSDPIFVDHVEGGLDWVLGLTD